MKFREKYIKRLLKLAHHLTSGRLYERYVTMQPPDGFSEDEPPVYESKDGIEFAYLKFVVDELPYLFPEDFKFNKSYDPYLVKKPELNPHEAFNHFMGLTIKEFLHIATPNSQKREWGGIILPYHATAQDVGFQIFELVGWNMRMN